jgi:hypothetical protein
MTSSLADSRLSLSPEDRLLRPSGGGCGVTRYGAFSPLRILRSLKKP